MNCLLKLFAVAALSVNIGAVCAYQFPEIDEEAEACIANDDSNLGMFQCSEQANAKYTQKLEQSINEKRNSETDKTLAVFKDYVEKMAEWVAMANNASMDLLASASFKYNRIIDMLDVVKNEPLSTDRFSKSSLAIYDNMLECVNNAKENESAVKVCLNKSFSEADVILNKNYKLAKETCETSYEDSADRIKLCKEKLKLGERAWINYRDQTATYIAKNAEDNDDNKTLEVEFFKIFATLSQNDVLYWDYEENL